MAYWVKTDTDAKLAIFPRPRGGDWLQDEVHALRREGTDIIVSMLTQDEVDELGLANEKTASELAGIEYQSFPIPDRDVPSSTKPFAEFVDVLHSQWQNGKNIAIHCRAGIGRSSLLLASILVRDDMSSHEAFARISEARGYPVPDNKEQREWVERFASSVNLSATPIDR
jgi:protein tyrosine phosphatase